MSDQYSFDKLNIDEIVQWEIMFDTLSVERAEPFFVEMGLHFLNASAIRPIVRHFLEEIDPVDEDITKNKELLQKTFAKIENETNPDIAQQLYQWGKWVYTSKRQSGLYFWHVLLCWLAGLYNTHVPIVQPALDEQKLRAITQSIRNKFADDLDLEQKLENAEKLPKSKWEESVYQKTKDEYSPLMFANNIITDYKTQQIWDFIKTLLSKKELDTLLQWAKENAPSLQIDAELIRLPA